jgi:hypothetical protein
MATEYYNLYYKEQEGARILIGVVDKETILETKITITRDHVADCVKTQIDRIIAEYTDPRNEGWNGATWRVQHIDNQTATDALGSIITIDFTKPIATVLITYPYAPYFKRIEFWFRPIQINEY